jgi:hypothetical protein
MDQHRREALLKEYGEVSSNFRLLTDIRFKLLAFLPIAAAAAAALKGDSLGMHSLVVSIFGLAATIGLAIYHGRNDQLYAELVGRAAEIERTLGLPDGAFANRPRPWFTVELLGMKVKIDHGTGVGIVYAASATLWLFGVYFPCIELARRTSLIAEYVDPIWTYAMAFAVALLSTYLALKSIQRQWKARNNRMRELAAIAVERLGSLDPTGAAKDPAFIEACAVLAGIDSKTVQARAHFYGSLDEESRKHYMTTEPKLPAISHFVALLTDLPPRWILDCATNRRGTSTSIDKTATG